jgi:hypothetical protein
MSDYKQYSEVPAYEQAIWKDKMVANARDGVLIWGGKNGVLPPPVGEKINVDMNRLGNAVVVGYFSQHGFLGLRTKLDNPPDWYLKQNGGNVIGHIYGPEFKPLET